MHFKFFLLNISRVLHFYYGQQFVHANDTGVCGLCHGVFIQRTVEVQVIGLQMSVPLKRYNCYTEKNIVISVLR